MGLLGGSVSTGGRGVEAEPRLLHLYFGTRGPPSRDALTNLTANSRPIDALGL
jgi:hypothetical protein